eukprot:tig00020961_g16624.t1
MCAACHAAQSLLPPPPPPLLPPPPSPIFSPLALPPLALRPRSGGAESRAGPGACRDGLEATRRIRAEVPASRQPWIIALTANALAEDKANAYHAGFNDYLTKPIKMEHLRAAIERIPQGRPAAGPGPAHALRANPAPAPSGSSSAADAPAAAAGAGSSSSGPGGL